MTGPNPIDTIREALTLLRGITFPHSTTNETYREAVELLARQTQCAADAEARAVAAETALAEANRELCPVCGHKDWDIDYDYTDDGEMRVDRCANCQWPPPYPVTVMEWKRKHFISPYIEDLEAGLEAAETALAEATMQANGWRAIAEDANGVMFVTRAEAAERRANDLADALRQITQYATMCDASGGLPSSVRLREIARAALDRHTREGTDAT